MTDNGSAYRSHDFRNRLAQAAIRHIRTRPYTPRTNGKAERFIQTSLREAAQILFGRVRGLISGHDNQRDRAYAHRVHLPQ
jgi:transposase InsO family protein